MDDQVPPIVGDFAAETPIFVVRPFINQLVICLERAEPVQIKLLKMVHGLELFSRLWFLVPAVEKSFAILGPGGSRKLYPFDLIVQVLGDLPIPDLPFLPI